MLLRIIPLAALLITLLTLLFSVSWGTAWTEGLYAPTHSRQGWF